MKSGLLSVILLSYYSKEKIHSVYYSLKSILDIENIPFEFIIMDDGSQDNSYEIALDLERKEKNVIAYQLSRNYTSIYSMFAGLSICKGDCATAIPDDDQQPYQSIVNMYRLWQKGDKVILPYRETRKDNPINRFISGSFYKIINQLSDVTFPKGGADLFFIDREVIDLVNSKIHPINTSLITELLRLGFDTTYLPYERPVSTREKSRWTLKKKIRLAKDVFFSTSSFPIKFISMVGFMISIFSFGLILLYLYIKLFGNPLFWGVFPQGWISIILLLSFFSGIILLALGIIAEYIYRIYEEVKNRPGYIIKKKE